MPLPASTEPGDPAPADTAAHRRAAPGAGRDHDEAGPGSEPLTGAGICTLTLNNVKYLLFSSHHLHYTS